MKIRSRWLTWVAAATVVGLTKLLFATCRKVYIGASPHSRLDFIPTPADRERFVLCVWHDELLIPTFTPPRRLREQVCCLVSQHQDGSYLANAMSLLGYSTVRGSSRRGGANALRQLLEDTAGKHIVFTPDGPCGPRRQLKQGCVFVASQLGLKLLPGAFVATKGWRPKGKWTDLLIPKPFSTIFVITGEPITVPADISREQLQDCIAQAQQAMDRLSEQAQRILSGQEEPSVEQPRQDQSDQRAAA
jgi:lysophospholipid acyltransferase (LPLAT)-like uncharacterized protein